VAGVVVRDGSSDCELAEAVTELFDPIINSTRAASCSVAMSRSRCGIITAQACARMCLDPVLKFDFTHARTHTHTKHLATRKHAPLAKR